MIIVISNKCVLMLIFLTRCAEWSTLTEGYYDCVLFCVNMHNKFVYSSIYDLSIKKLQKSEVIFLQFVYMFFLSVDRSIHIFHPITILQ